MTESRTRIITTHGTNYIVEGHVDEIRERWANALDLSSVLELLYLQAHAMFPSVRMYLRADAVESIQAVSQEAWAWQVQAEEDYYAKQFGPDVPAQMAEAVSRLAAAAEREAGTDE